MLKNDFLHQILKNVIFPIFWLRMSGFFSLKLSHPKFNLYFNCIPLCSLLSSFLKTFWISVNEIQQTWEWNYSIGFNALLALKTSSRLDFFSCSINNDEQVFYYELKLFVTAMKIHVWFIINVNLQWNVDLLFFFNCSDQTMNAYQCNIFCSLSFSALVPIQ